MFYRLACGTVGVGLVLATALGSSRAAVRSPDEPFTLGSSVLERDELVRAVLERNPGIEAARQAWIAASRRAERTDYLEDPTIAYSMAPLSIGSNDVRYGQEIGFRQRLPYPGTLPARVDVATGEAEILRHDVEALRLELARMASVLFDDYYLVARATEINDEHILLLEEFQRIATTRYAVGTASQQDPLRAEVEASHLLHDRASLRTEREIVTAQINVLLHRPPDAFLPPAPDSLPLPPHDATDFGELQRQALAERPELKGSEAEITSRSAEVRLGELGYRPTFEAFSTFSTMWNETEHRWMIGVGINLPVRRSRVRAEIAEAEARLGQAQSERVRLEDAIRGEVVSAAARVSEAGHIVELFRSRILPASRDQVNAARAGYETGRDGFLELIDAERNLRDVELGYENSVTDLYRRRADLDRAVGRLSQASGEQP